MEPAEPETLEDEEATSDADRAILPPPPPGSAVEGDERATKRTALVAILAAIAVMIMAGFGLLWINAQDDRDAAIDQRDAAEAEAAEASAASRAALGDLATEVAARQDAEAEIERLTAELETATAAESAATDELSTADALAEELSGDLADARAANVELTEEIERLQTDAAAADAPFVAADHPEFSRWIGETLSSRNGSSRLTVDQSRCFGGTVVETIGLDGVGAALHNAATAADNNTLVGTMQAAADSCGIDQTLIFS